MQDQPNDRLKKNGQSNGNPKIINSVDIKIPDKEVHIMQPGEKAPDGGGSCSCHSVPMSAELVSTFPYLPQGFRAHIRDILSIAKGLVALARKR